MFKPQLGCRRGLWLIVIPYSCRLQASDLDIVVFERRLNRRKLIEPQLDFVPDSRQEFFPELRAQDSMQLSRSRNQHFNHNFLVTAQSK